MTKLSILRNCTFTFFYLRNKCCVKCLTFYQPDQKMSQKEMLNFVVDMIPPSSMALEIEEQVKRIALWDRVVFSAFTIMHLADTHFCLKCLIQFMYSLGRKHRTGRYYVLCSARANNDTRAEEHMTSH